MKIAELLESLSEISNNDEVETFDITSKEGYKEFKDTLNSLRDTDNSLFDLFEINMDELIDNIEELGDKIYKEKNKETPKKANVEREEIDHTVGEEFKRPSELLTIDQKLQLHKLVQEYVDTTIKPFNKGILTNDQINDAYAGLYEFAAWVLNKKN